MEIEELERPLSIWNEYQRERKVRNSTPHGKKQALYIRRP